MFLLGAVTLAAALGLFTVPLPIINLPEIGTLEWMKYFLALATALTVLAAGFLGG